MAAAFGAAAGELLGAAATLGGTLGAARISADNQKYLQQKDFGFRQGIIDQHRLALSQSGLPAYMAYQSQNSLSTLGANTYASPNTFVSYNRGSTNYRPYATYSFSDYQRSKHTGASTTRGSAQSGFTNPNYASNRNPFATDGNNIQMRPVNYSDRHNFPVVQWHERGQSDA
uniref:VP2 n=1 Tax=Wenling callionymus kaianus calicivirus TaxID=2116387 RepID=A0A2P1GMJ0_9CALI|nr:VP2 [Wenling callionymus kaianus calicivirus]